MNWWKRLWHREDTSESQAALAAAIEQRAEAEALARRVEWHRKRNHFAERIGKAYEGEPRWR